MIYPHTGYNEFEDEMYDEFMEYLEEQNYTEHKGQEKVRTLYKFICCSRFYSYYFSG
jgi:uncharacterized protein YggL (DUF469 family)